SSGSSAARSSTSRSSGSAAWCSGGAGAARSPSSPRCSSRGTSSPPRAPRPARKRAWYSVAMTHIPIQVYGINLLVRLMSEAPADVRVHCPKGSPIRYGEVVARGDGFDEGANAFREMPELKAVVAFEESVEEVRSEEHTSELQSR